MVLVDLHDVSTFRRIDELCRTLAKITINIEL